MQKLALGLSLVFALIGAVRLVNPSVGAEPCKGTGCLQSWLLAKDGDAKTDLGKGGSDGAKTDLGKGSDGAKTDLGKDPDSTAKAYLGNHL